MEPEIEQAEEPVIEVMPESKLPESENEET
jgi:hypothetical protein